MPILYSINFHQPCGQKPVDTSGVVLPASALAFSSVLIAITELPVQPDAQLNLARRGLGGGDATGGSNQSARLSEHRVVAQRRCEVRVIQDVEEFCAELHTEAFGDPGYGYVLVERHIQVEEMRAGRDIAARVTQSRDRVRRGEAFGIDVAKRIRGVLYFAPRNIIGPAVNIRTLKPQRISAYDHGKGHARTGAKYAA